MKLYREFGKNTILLIPAIIVAVLLFTFGNITGLVLAQNNPTSLPTSTPLPATEGPDLLQTSEPDGEMAAIPLCPTSMSFGSTIQCSILKAGEIDKYTFTATAGSKVLVRIVKTSGTLWPKISIYNPSGSKLCEKTASNIAEIPSCTLPISGIYTLRIADGYNGKYLGSYFLYLQRLNNPGVPVSVTLGSTRSASISAPAEMDTFTFSANAGDKVLVRMTKTSGTLYPSIRIYNPAGIKLCTKTSSITAEIASCTLSITGKYTLLLSDGYNGKSKGNYNVFLQKLKKPVIPILIEFGNTLTGSIIKPAQMKTYTFSANAGDSVLLRVLRVSGNLEPAIRIYSPSGTKLCENSGYSMAEIENCALPSNGNYTVFVFDDYYGTYSGEYYIHLQRLNNPGNATAMVFGETDLGTISFHAEMDAFTFTAAANDKVQVRMSKSSVDLWPGIRIYSPTGTNVCNNYGSTTAEIEICTLSANGTYTILAYDYLDGSNTGDYYIYLQRLNNPGNATAMTFGETLSGTVNYPAEADAFTFTATANDKVQVRMSKSSVDLWPGIRIYSPTGANVCNNYGSTTAEIEICTLPASGIYTILSYDYLDGTNTGDYSIYLQRLNNPGNAVAINYGSTLSGTINYPAEADTFTFTVVSGDKILVRMSKTSGGLWPGIRIYNPAGVNVCNDYGSTTAEIESCTLSSSGTYTILAYDYLDGSNIGDFFIYLQSINHPGNATPISIGDTLGSSISSAAKMGTFTFSISSSTTVTTKVTRTSGTFWPGIRIYNPTGLLLCSNYGSTTAEIINCSLSTNGTYTILIYDYLSGTNTGDYSLYLH